VGILLKDIKDEVKHISKDYYAGMPILSLKEIEWLIGQAELANKYKWMIEYGLTFEDFYNPDDEVNPHCR
jgi:hypothetical protein